MNRIKKILGPAERIFLDGRKYPNGKKIGEGISRQERVRGAAPSIMAAYDALQGQGDSKTGQRLMARVYYLARNIDGPLPYEQFDLEFGLQEEDVKRIKHISGEGRLFYLGHPSSVEERIESARLYSNGGVFTAAVKDPKRGCSASICTNCVEPLAFCDFVCFTCDYEVIGAHGMPTVEEWSQMDIHKRKVAMDIGLEIMMEDILKKGDWRGLQSPLNRYAPAGTDWGGLGRVRLNEEGF